MVSPTVTSILAGPVALQLGPLASPPGILATLIVLTIIVLVGRFLLSVAWRLLLIAIAVVAVLWILGVLGFVLDVLSVGSVSGPGLL